MRYVVTDNRINEKCENALKGRGFELIKMPSFSSLQEPVSAHPDMLLFLEKGRLVCHKDYFGIASEQIKKIADISGSEITLSEESIGQNYPGDVLFNAAPIGGMLICKRDTISEKIALLYGEESVINVKQGYAKCSVCVVGDNAIITADVSIAKAAEKNGIDVLLVSPRGIRLDGYDCGFIGGASGADGENIYFCGNTDLHPDGYKIKEFCKKHGKAAVSLSDEPLYDYGTLMFI